MNRNFNKGAAVICGILAFAFAAGVLIVRGMTGKTSLYVDTTGNVRKAVVVCESSDIKYNLPSSGVKPISEKISVNMIFDDEDMETMGLTYIATYSGADDAAGAKNVMSPNFGLALSEAGISKETDLDYKFTVDGSSVIMNLYASKAEINSKTAKFLMIDSESDGQIALKKKAGYVSNYENQGFSCKEN